MTEAILVCEACKNSVGLEVEPKLELDKASARIVRSRNSEIAVSRTCLAKRRGVRRRGECVIARGLDSEVRPVECVEELNAELEVRVFRYPRPLHQVQVEPCLPRTVQEYARAELACLGRRAEVGLIRLEVRKRLAAYFKRGQRVVDDVLGQPVNDPLAFAGRADCFLANLDQLPKLFGVDVKQRYA